MVDVCTVVVEVAVVAVGAHHAETVDADAEPGRTRILLYSLAAVVGYVDGLEYPAVVKMVVVGSGHY